MGGALPGGVAESRRWSAGEVARIPELWIFLVLLGLAAVGGPRFDDDSYGHYARSTRQVLGFDLLTWVTDVWNKPLPGLAYGLGSLNGLWGARAVACVFTVCAAYFTRRLVESWWPKSWQVSAAALLLFFSQTALLKDAFVTMTEVPAAMFLAWSLYALFVEARPRKAALLAGFVPLCRVEMVPVVAVTALFCGFEEWRGKHDPRPWLRTLVTIAVCGGPFLIWIGVGIAATGDMRWFSRASYAYLRINWELGPLLRYNVLTGLVNVLSPPLLVLGVYCGVVWWSRAVRAVPRVVLHLLLLLAVHYLLLNVLVVYPKDWFGVPPGHGVAAINGRNYTSSAPVLVALLAIGAAFEHGSPLLRVLPASVPSRVFRATAAVFATLLSAGLIFLSKRGADRGLHLGLAAVGLGLLLWQILGRSPSAAAASKFPRQLKVFACAGAVAALVIRPFFWYPVPSTDQRALATVELARHIAERRPARVIQDSASFLEVAAAQVGIDVSRTETQWTWPGDYPSRLSASPPGTWVVLELNPKGELLPRYPQAILDQIRGGELVPVVQFQAAPHQGFWGALDRISARNAAIGWRVFQRRGEVRP